MNVSRNQTDLYDPDRLYAVARMYYEDNQSQSNIATHLKVSRPTVSRMLSQARDIGMVHISVIHPTAGADLALTEQLRVALGLDAVYLGKGLQTTVGGTGMQAPVIEAIHDMNLAPGDGLVIATGQAIYGVSTMDLPSLDGVRLAPAVGGVSEPEPWHQTNEITRTIALKTGSTYTPVFAEAIPSATLFTALQQDAAYKQVEQVWRTAKAALVGVGSPTTARTSIASSIPKDSLQESVGDVCLHFFDIHGHSLDYPGCERTVRIPLEQLRTIPYATAVALGPEKIQSIIQSSRMGLYKRLVSDEATARAILAALENSAHDDARRTDSGKYGESDEGGPVIDAG